MTNTYTNHTLTKALQQARAVTPRTRPHTVYPAAEHTITTMNHLYALKSLHSGELPLIIAAAFPDAPESAQGELERLTNTLGYISSASPQFFDVMVLLSLKARDNPLSRAARKNLSDHMKQPSHPLLLSHSSTALIWAAIYPMPLGEAIEREYNTRLANMPARTRRAYPSVEHYTKHLLTPKPTHVSAIYAAAAAVKAKWIETVPIIMQTRAEEHITPIINATPTGIVMDENIRALANATLNIFPHLTHASPDAPTHPAPAAVVEPTPPTHPDPSVDDIFEYV